MLQRLEDAIFQAGKKKNNNSSLETVRKLTGLLNKEINNYFLINKEYAPDLLCFVRK